MDVDTINLNNLGNSPTTETLWLNNDRGLNALLNIANNNSQRGSGCGDPHGDDDGCGKCGQRGGGCDCNEDDPYYEKYMKYKAKYMKALDNIQTGGATKSHSVSVNDCHQNIRRIFLN